MVSLSPLILITLGVIFLFIELITLTFFSIFIAIGFFVVGAVAFFMEFGILWQLFFVALISLVMTFLLKKPIKKHFNKSDKTIKDNFLDESGVGVVKNGMIYYKGTFWRIDDIGSFDEGDRVEVLGVDGNRLLIKGRVEKNR
ncbi:NfeD family protein [uncultured Campylobacter sp.]|uniref:NfeD family protein n=1 Tax=uncultured Campylobacter sp. TaxID=218934 RepID=UPI002603CB61|nr:NfeD family protein [uncultured Campylobacter sp.]